ncbi:MAG: hypothetical protein K0S33_239 [Bacteroidetes bacterium]|jgi:hypothetical protein|nr:hypothetical protein [Bacteroidota bacterium]
MICPRILSFRNLNPIYFKTRISISKKMQFDFTSGGHGLVSGTTFSDLLQYICKRSSLLNKN